MHLEAYPRPPSTIKVNPRPDDGHRRPLALPTEPDPGLAPGPYYVPSRRHPGQVIAHLRFLADLLSRDHHPGSGAERLIAEWWNQAGYWPLPYRDKIPGAGMAGWGERRPTARELREQYRSLGRRYSRIGVGLMLGHRGGLIDVDVDDPDEAEPAIGRLFPGSCPETFGWSNPTNGRYHYLFRYDDRVAGLGRTIVKGFVRGDGSVGGNPNYLGVEIKLGAPPGSNKSLAVAIPPSLYEGSTRRTWNGVLRIAPLPETVIADLDAHAGETTGDVGGAAPHSRATQKERGGRGKGRLGSPEARAVGFARWCARNRPAIQGQRGSDQLFAVAMLGPGFDLSAEMTVKIILENYNPACVPPWSEAEVAHKVADVFARELRRGWMI